MQLDEHNGKAILNDAKKSVTNLIILFRPKKSNDSHRINGHVGDA